ncbi:hypothetical protein SAMN05421754_100271 [Nitrosomonas sp. Nm58]|nr:hypothetical protein SAMN05421754_100271 [Nitrosomonas sp. Nm58]
MSLACEGGEGGHTPTLTYGAIGAEFSSKKIRSLEIF